MMEHNGCPHSKRGIGLDLRCLLNTIERELPSAQDHGVLAIGLQEVYSLFFLFCGNRDEKWPPSLWCNNRLCFFLRFDKIKGHVTKKTRSILLHRCVHNRQQSRPDVHLPIGIIDPRPVTRKIVRKTQHLFGKGHNEGRLYLPANKRSTMHKRCIACIRVSDGNGV